MTTSYEETKITLCAREHEKKHLIDLAAWLDDRRDYCPKSYGTFTLGQPFTVGL